MKSITEPVSPKLPKRRETVTNAPDESSANSDPSSNRGSEYWRIYHDDATLARGDQLREVHTIRSGGAPIHIDVYPQPDPDAPVLIFNHGAAGYCRMFVPAALTYYDRGYTFILPDQIGQGMSGGRRGDYTVAQATESIVDVARWAKSRWNGPVFMAGGSIGGGLTYYAAAAGAPVEAITCLNLVDFSSVDSWDFSKLAPLAKLPGMQAIARAFLWLLTPLHGVRFPFSWVGRFHKIMDSRDTEFQALWDADPLPPRNIAIRYMASSFTTPPAVPLEENRLPTLVINQALDEMVDPELTRRNYDRLGGPKEYLEVQFGHWSSDPEFWHEIVEASDQWFRKHMDQERSRA